MSAEALQACIAAARERLHDVRRALETPALDDTTLDDALYAVMQALNHTVDAIELLAEDEPDEYDGLSCERCGVNPAATCECDE